MHQDFIRPIKTSLAPGALSLQSGVGGRCGLQLVVGVVPGVRFPRQAWGQGGWERPPQRHPRTRA